MSLQAKTQEAREIGPRQKFEGHTSWVTGVIHLLGGQRMITCSYDGSLRVWNLQTAKQIGNNWQSEEGGVGAIALSPDGTKVVCTTDDSEVLLWNADTEKIIWTGQHAGDIRCVCWNRDGGRVVSGSSDGTAKVWDVESGKTVLEIEAGPSDVQAMICSPDMTMIAIGGYESYTPNSHEFLKIWDANTGKFITDIKGSTGGVECLAWTADGKTLISGSSDCLIRTWNTTTWQQINVLTGHTSLVHSIALSPNGLILASASWDETARLWDLQNSQPIGMPLQHPDDVECVSFSTDGKLLATACDDRNAYSWDVAAIVREAGLEELLLSPNDGDKSLLNANATRHPRQRRDVHRIPERFFDDSPRSRLPHSSGTRETTLSTSQHHSPRPTLLGHVSLLFRRTHHITNDMTPRPRLLERTRNPFSGTTHRRNDEGTEFQEHDQSVVDVPLANGHFRNYSARELLMKRKKEREKAAAAKNASVGSSRPPQGSVQQSGGAALAQPSSNLHVTVSTSSTTPAIASTSPDTTSTTSPPGVMIPRTGRWTRFRLFICCVPTQTIDGHH